MKKSFILIAMLCMSLNVQNVVAEDEATGPTLSVAQLDVLPMPSSCASEADREKRVYEILVSNISDDAILVLRTKGSESKNLKIPLARLLAEEVQLPALKITGRLSDTRKRRGLWAEHPESKQTVQLSYLPGFRHCNSKGITTVSYRNLWVRAKKS